MVVQERLDRVFVWRRRMPEAKNERLIASARTLAARIVEPVIRVQFTRMDMEWKATSALSVAF